MTTAVLQRQRFVGMKHDFQFCSLWTATYLFCDLVFFSIDGHQLGVLRVLVSVGAPHTVYHHLPAHNATQTSTHTIPARFLSCCKFVPVSLILNILKWNSPGQIINRRDTHKVST